MHNMHCMFAINSFFVNFGSGVGRCDLQMCCLCVGEVINNLWHRHKLYHNGYSFKALKGCIGVESPRFQRLVRGSYYNYCGRCPQFNALCAFSASCMFARNSFFGCFLLKCLIVSILHPGSCILYLVSCILYLVSCILYLCIPYPASCILSLSCILYPASPIHHQTSTIYHLPSTI